MNRFLFKNQIVAFSFLSLAIGTFIIWTTNPFTREAELLIPAIVFLLVCSYAILKREHIKIKTVNKETMRLNACLTFHRNATDEHSIISISDIKGKIIYVNDLFCETAGYTKKELIGQNHRLINSGYHSKAFFKEMWSTIARGETWQGEIKNKKKDGGYYWVKSTIVPELDESGKLLSYLAIRTDITEQKIAVQSAREHRRLAVNAYKAKSIFLSTMSHELRTPLNAIIGFTEVLESKSLGNEIVGKNAEYLGYIKLGGQRMATLVNDILDLEKIETGKYQLKNINFCLSNFIKELCVEIRPLLIKEKLHLNLDISPEVKSFTGDRRMISKIFHNLTSNAIKHAPHGSTISINLQQMLDRSIIFSVQDEGHGFTANAMAHLASPFHLDEDILTKQDLSGIGLGLYMTKKLTKLHNADLELENVPDSGAKVSVYFKNATAEKALSDFLL